MLAPRLWFLAAATPMAKSARSVGADFRVNFPPAILSLVGVTRTSEFDKVRGQNINLQEKSKEERS